jgi:hypothetical protein
MKVALLACGGWVAAAVSAAAELRIADRLDAGPKSVEALAAEAHVEPRVLLRVLRALAMHDVFEEQADGRFANTEESRVLLTGQPGSMRAFCQLAGGLYQRIFDDLPHALRTGEPATWRALGGPLYAHLDAHADVADVYDRGMEDLAQFVGPLLAKRVPLDDVRTIVDIGGGRGTLVKALLARLPGARGVVLDRASVCDRAAADVAKTDPAMAARLEFRAGDFFADVPQGADLYLLKNVLHNWNDEHAGAILATIRRAVSDSSRLFVLEPPAEGQAGGAFQRLDDLMQVVICDPGTVARTEEELRALLSGAGFAVAGVTPLKTGHVVLDARAADRT